MRDDCLIKRRRKKMSKREAIHARRALLPAMLRTLLIKPIPFWSRHKICL